jgi:hypothetical protein
MTSSPLLPLHTIPLILDNREREGQPDNGRRLENEQSFIAGKLGSAFLGWDFQAPKREDEIANGISLEYPQRFLLIYIVR